MKIGIVGVRCRPGQNRVTLKTPRRAAFVPLQEPVAVLAFYVPHTQTQVWSNTSVVVHNLYFARVTRSWCKLAVETWRVKTELIIITILHIIIATTSILNLSFKTIAPKILAHTKWINKYWKYTQYLQQQNQAKSRNFGACLKYQQIHKILALHENIGGIPKYWHFTKI